MTQTQSTSDVSQLRRIDHAEAMQITAVENERLLEAIGLLTTRTRPT